MSPALESHPPNFCGGRPQLHPPVWCSSTATPHAALQSPLASCVRLTLSTVVRDLLSYSLYAIIIILIRLALSCLTNCEPKRISFAGQTLTRKSGLRNKERVLIHYDSTHTVTLMLLGPETSYCTSASDSVIIIIIVELVAIDTACSHIEPSNCVFLCFLSYWNGRDCTLTRELFCACAKPNCPAVRKRHG